MLVALVIVPLVIVHAHGPSVSPVVAVLPVELAHTEAGVGVMTALPG